MVQLSPFPNVDLHGPIHETTLYKPVQSGQGMAMWWVRPCPFVWILVLWHDKQMFDGSGVDVRTNVIKYYLFVLILMMDLRDRLQIRLSYIFSEKKKEIANPAGWGTDFQSSWNAFLFSLIHQSIESIQTIDWSVQKRMRVSCECSFETFNIQWIHPAASPDASEPRVATHQREFSRTTKGSGEKIVWVMLPSPLTNGRANLGQPITTASV